MILYLKENLINNMNFLECYNYKGYSNIIQQKANKQLVLGRF